MNELEQTIKGLQQNEEQAIKLLNENVRLKYQIKQLNNKICELQEKLEEYQTNTMLREVEETYNIKKEERWDNGNLEKTK